MFSYELSHFITDSKMRPLEASELRQFHPMWTKVKLIFTTGADC
jgi:hypothetical protein